MAERPVEERIRDFEEVDTGMTPGEAMEEAARCLQCKKPACINGCPVGIDIPGFIAEIAEGRFSEARSRILEANLLPAICGRVCPQESQCEGACVLAGKERAINIGALERFAADNGVAELGEERPVSLAGRRIAVVGSGPAGLTAAAELARRGHKITLFESLHEPGGVLVYGIPEFRLPKAIVSTEIERVLALGVELRTNTLVGNAVPVDDLMTFDAVFVATGAGLPVFMGIPGEETNGVYSANEFLTRVNLMRADCFPEAGTPVKRGSRVVVTGAGNVAMDAARVARRLGARVILVYRRREEDFPARCAEVRHAREEGVEFVTCAAPVRIHGTPSVTGVECVRMEMCELDASGRPEPRAIEGSSFIIDADCVIQAIGTSPNPLLVRLLSGAATGRKGNLVVDEDGRTTVPWIYAGGDIATGAATVILAMGAGKRAASVIDSDLASRPEGEI
ncbi:MAG: NADPH-dependent glutamate synthase [Methanospirillum sp.]|nr:NADPH-dependent glutamate synthase [Methanospirillum sp.]